MNNLETVRTEVRDNSLVIYLSREERMNAFTLSMQQEIVKVLDDAEQNDDIKAIIFTIIQIKNKLFKKFSSPSSKLIPTIEK